MFFLVDNFSAGQDLDHFIAGWNGDANPLKGAFDTVLHFNLFF